jgi:hypothetical protein
MNSTVTNLNRLLNIENSLDQLTKSRQTINNSINKTNNVFSHIFVDVNKSKRFTKENLQTLKNIVSLEAWPELYGDDLPEGIDFNGFEIINLSELDSDLSKTYGSQTARLTDNPKYAEIKNDILTNGFKLRYPPVQVRVIEKDGNKQYTIINGRTRAKILKNNTVVENIIVATYIVKDNYTFKTQSLKFNCTGIPDGTATLADVIHVASQLILEGSLSKKLKDIRNWLFGAVGNGVFTESKKDQLAQSIYNNAHLSPQIYSWRPETIDEWMTNHNFTKVYDYYKKTNTYCGLPKNSPIYLNLSETKEEQNKNLYIVISCSVPAKSLYAVGKLMSMNAFKGKTVRVILHTGTLTGTATTKDLVKQYNDLIEEHNEFFNTGLDNYAEAFFCNKKGIAPKVNSTFVLYAALPAISSEHNMDKFVLL